MAKHIINHVLSRLLRESTIEHKKNPSLFESLLILRSDVEARLRELGMELVLISDAGIAHARNMTSEQLDALAEELGVEPLSPVCGHHRLTYYQSVAVIYFRLSLDQEMRQGGDPLWLSKSEVYEALSKHYSEAVAEDGVALEERITKCLSKLIDEKLIDIRSMGASSSYRGTALMRAAFSKDALAAFAQDMNMVADQEGSDAPDEPESLVRFDTLEPSRETAESVQE